MCVSQKERITITTEDLVTVLQAAKELGLHHTTIYRRIEAGKIASLRLGGILFIPKSEVERLINEKALVHPQWPKLKEVSQ